MDESPLPRLRRLWSEVVNLDRVHELLSWDQETMMPAAAGADRGEVLATVAGLRHARLVDPALEDALAATADALVPGSPVAAEVARIRRRTERARAVPERLARELSATTSTSLLAWQEARSRNDFAVLAPALERLVGLKREEGQACGSSEVPPYQALLDEFEPQVTLEELDTLFAALLEGIAPRVAELPDDEGRTPLGDAGAYPADRQRELALQLATLAGFDAGRGRLDRSEHPFCVGIGRNDVRLTWRWNENDFRPGILGVLHETGHGLYEQGLPELEPGNALAEATSLSIHESQARFYENHVGRSLALWRALLPRFRTLFPGAPLDTPERIWTSLNETRRSLIRVDADETSYDLHIVIRYRLERRLLQGELPVPDLPAAWAREYDRLLGLEPPDDRRGVLQDVHWPAGLFGYFPTYTLGNLTAAQLREAIEAELGPLDRLLGALELAPILEWMRDRIHRHGAALPPAELVERATGRPREAAPFLRRLDRLASERHELREEATR